MLKKLILICFCLCVLLAASFGDDNVTNIKEDKIKQFKIDIYNIIEHLLNDKITYTNTTLAQMLVDFDREGTEIYSKYLQDRNNRYKNTQYAKRLKTITGTLGAYSYDICSELGPVSNKYKLGLVPGAECDTYFYDEYVIKYNISNAQDFYKLIKSRQDITDKLFHYLQDIENSPCDTD